MKGADNCRQLTADSHPILVCTLFVSLRLQLIGARCEGVVTCHRMRGSRLPAKQVRCKTEAM